MQPEFRFAFNYFPQFIKIDEVRFQKGGNIQAYQRKQDPRSSKTQTDQKNRKDEK